MPKGYWIAQVDVHDIDSYRNIYVAQNGPIFKKYGARFLARGGAFEDKEGARHRTRNVVIEFPDYATALACYASPEYQRLVGLRAAFAEGELIIVEGYDGPQPGDRA